MLSGRAPIPRHRASIPAFLNAALWPKFSVAWDGDTLRYFVHKDSADFHAGWRLALPLIPEWAKLWSWYWLRGAARLPYIKTRKLWRGLRRNPNTA